MRLSVGRRLLSAAAVRRAVTPLAMTSAALGRRMLSSAASSSFNSRLFKPAACSAHHLLSALSTQRRCFHASTRQLNATAGIRSSIAAPRLTILFGSQTGTAMGFAHELRKAARKHKIGGAPIDAVVVDLNEYDPKRLLTDAGVVVLITACFGKGEPTDNAKNFFQWLMDPVCMHVWAVCVGLCPLLCLALRVRLLNHSSIVCFCCFVV
jgi:sulfite reductase alpha subunit-like flavoprotein